MTHRAKRLYCHYQLPAAALVWPLLLTRGGPSPAPDQLTTFMNRPLPPGSMSRYSLAGKVSIECQALSPLGQGTAATETCRRQDDSRTGA